MEKNWVQNRLDALNKTKNYAVSAVLAFVFCRNRKYYYVDCFGTLNPVALFFKNLFSPSRFITKVRYGQVPGAPKFLDQSKPIAKTRENSVTFNAVVAAKSREFKENGIVILERYFTPLIEELERRYGVGPQYFQGSNMTYVSRRFDIRKEDIVAQIALDPTVLAIIGSYFGCQPYLRTNPHMTATCPEVDFQEFLKNKVEMFSKDDKTGNMNWHYDTANLVSVIIPLNEGSQETTHMLYAKKSHRKQYNQLRSKFDYFYSEEIVRDNFEILSCVCPKGSAIIFDTNGLHRMNPIKGTFRSLLHALYTPGNDRFWLMPSVATPAGQMDIKLLVDPDSIPSANLNNLDELQARAIDGLFPKNETLENLQKVAVG